MKDNLKTRGFVAFEFYWLLVVASLALGMMATFIKGFKDSKDIHQEFMKERSRPQTPGVVN